MLISIEGTDSSGKQTQTKMTYEYFEKKGLKTRQISFPDYDSDSSALVKMYLNGDFGKNPGDVSAEVASIFFACDRFASFRTSWKKYYDEGYIIISDRYTSSNIINQASKIEDYNERLEYIDWIEDMEYRIFSVPQPDITIFLDMPYEKSIELMKNRDNKITGEKIKDIHESNEDYLRKSYENAVDICNKLLWNRITCVNEKGHIKRPEEINSEIIKTIEGVMYGI
ncbi:dTMP kinase [Proteocatella sphenisci]|uniref:dTMP kinase n=1 Tax=Proteocatella sphenisci TaxID=181070 RepID=UPI0004BB4C95|nr:deoxynucleoside kinase [Proteocatella sphenisci]